MLPFRLLFSFQQLSSLQQQLNNTRAENKTLQAFVHQYLAFRRKEIAAKKTSKGLLRRSLVFFSGTTEDLCLRFHFSLLSPSRALRLAFNDTQLGCWTTASQHGRLHLYHSGRRPCGTHGFYFAAEMDAQLEEAGRLPAGVPRSRPRG